MLTKDLCLKRRQMKNEFAVEAIIRKRSLDGEST